MANEMRSEPGFEGTLEMSSEICDCTAAEEGSRESCDSQCRKLTASWVREAKANNPDIETCQFYEGLESAGAEGVMDAGV